MLSDENSFHPCLIICPLQTQSQLRDQAEEIARLRAELAKSESNRKAVSVEVEHMRRENGGLMEIMRGSAPEKIAERDALILAGGKKLILDK
jgi:hypothetical protein